MIWSAIASAWTAFAKLPRGWHIAMAVVALCLLAFALHRCAVSDAVEADRKAVESETAKKALGAERTANRADVTRQAEIQANDAATRKAIDDAVAKHPATVPAGPAVQAAIENLRPRAERGRGSRDKGE